MNKNDGGPAFPGEVRMIVKMFGEATGKEYDHETWQYQSGMSLRAYLSGQALSNFEIRRYQHPENYYLIAQACVAIADAMIEEVEK